MIRAIPLGELTAGAACELSRGLLETVPAMARGIRGTVVETTCRERGADACLYTLLWDATLGVMALYRPYSRHGPWVAQTGQDAMVLLDPDLDAMTDAGGEHWPPSDQLPPVSDHEPDSQGGT